jgi:hypothetical protein
MEHDADVTGLTRIELLVLAGLLRLMVRADGKVDPAEIEALDGVHLRVAELLGDEGAAYRASAARKPIDEATWGSIWDMSASQQPGRDRVLAAAARVERAEAREAIYAILCDVAAADTIAPAETALLDHLASTWGLVVG